MRHTTAMKSLLALLVFLPTVVFGQRNLAFVKLTSATGLPIRGTSVAARFPRQIEAASVQSNAAANDTRISFTMPVGSASGELRAALNAKQVLPNGEVLMTARKPDQMESIYKINMENIRVETCDDIQGADGQLVTRVVLRAVRIGWTYYSYNRSGVMSVSSKTGWDSERSSVWTGF